MDDEEHIAKETFYVIYIIGSVFIGYALYTVFKAGNAFSRRATSRRRIDVANTKSERIDLAPKRQAAVDKPVEHALYLNSLKGLHGNVVGLSLSTNGKVASVTDDQLLKISDIKDVGGKTHPSVRAVLSRQPVDVAFGSETELFVLTEDALGNAVLELFSLHGGKVSQAWEVTGFHGKEAAKGLAAGVNQHGHTLILSWSAKTDLCVFNAHGKQLARVNSSGLQHHDATLSRQAKFFGAATFTSDVKLYEIQFGREGDFRQAVKVMDLKKAHKAQILCIDFSSDGTKAVTASKDGTWAVWNIDVRYAQDEDPKILLQRSQETGGRNYSQIAFGPTGIIAAAFGNTLHFLDSSKGVLLEIVEDAHEADVTALKWSPGHHILKNSKIPLLVTCGLDRRVRFWRAPLI